MTDLYSCTAPHWQFANPDNPLDEPTQSLGWTPGATHIFVGETDNAPICAWANLSNSNPITISDIPDYVTWNGVTTPWQAWTPCVDFETKSDLAGTGRFGVVATADDPGAYYGVVTNNYIANGFVNPYGAPSMQDIFNALELSDAYVVFHGWANNDMEPTRNPGEFLEGNTSYFKRDIWSAWALHTGWVDSTGLPLPIYYDVVYQEDYNALWLNALNEIGANSHVEIMWMMDESGSYGWWFNFHYYLLPMLEYLNNNTSYDVSLGIMAVSGYSSEIRNGVGWGYEEGCGMWSTGDVAEDHPIKPLWPMRYVSQDYLNELEAWFEYGGDLYHKCEGNGGDNPECFDFAIWYGITGYGIDGNMSGSTFDNGEGFDKDWWSRWIGNPYAPDGSNSGMYQNFIDTGLDFSWDIPNLRALIDITYNLSRRAQRDDGLDTGNYRQIGSRTPPSSRQLTNRRGARAYW